MTWHLQLPLPMGLDLQQIGISWMECTCYIRMGALKVKTHLAYSWYLPPGLFVSTHGLTEKHFAAVSIAMQQESHDWTCHIQFHTVIL